MSHKVVRALGSLSALLFVAASTPSADPPDLMVNPVSGLIETVDATWSGSNYNVRITDVTSDGKQVGSWLLTTNPANDLDPRIAIASTGDAITVWWRDLSVDQLVYRKRVGTNGSWGNERMAGNVSDSNSHPRIVYAFGKPYIAYQIQGSRNRSVGAQIIDETPEPVPSIVATTTYSGNLDIQLSFESGHLWVTWIDAGSNVGYSEYYFAAQRWSVPALESYAEDSAAAARDRIRTSILGHS